jgi:orotate phosphoribosyltransferase
VAVKKELLLFNCPATGEYVNIGLTPVLFVFGMAFKGIIMAVNLSLATFKSFTRTKFCVFSMPSVRDV